MLDKLADYIIAKWQILLFGIVSYFVLDDPNALVQTVLIVLNLEILAWQIYKGIIYFTIRDKELLDKFDGEDSKFSIMETTGFSQFQAYALLSAHILVGILAYSIYVVSAAPDIIYPR
jgi:hypothetical protein